MDRRSLVEHSNRTRLSSHGTVKGYPVVARCANLPVDIRNGERYGGGCVVGWLPIDIATSATMRSSDGYFPSFSSYPLIMKNCTKGKCLCPICLAPLEELSELSKTFDIRSVAQVKHALAVYQQKKSEGEAILKALGLQPVPLQIQPQNVFWKVAHSEPEEAASFDRLHYLHLGVWGYHLLSEIKILLDKIPHEHTAQLESQ
ncbi:hypothetical protein PAXINDRAFT_157859 [Paxillus involutus ATCC 200175]|uniref:Uncharacterized protein n=1 Tax=Paxillus involutus ATCC 200175 TaxID=664439 RepID=A0A0C9T1G0_PAXIN|nr:hypothetical protein PAXINDRAFT_157859 [Paxillus involutus ATCC 200175]